MTKPTIAAALRGVPIALAADYAVTHLAQELPAADQAGMADSVAASEDGRFAVSGGVAVVPVRGLLTPNAFAFERYFGWTTYFGLIDTLSHLTADEDVRAIVLDVDSPGGMVLGCTGAGEAVAAAAAAKPVHALANPLAASAAYWIACAAGEISMTPGAVVGSIGVAVSDFAHVAPDMGGRQWFDFTSTHARAKWPDPATDEGKAEHMRRLDEQEALFHAHVAAGRGIAPDELATRLSVTDDPRDGGAVFGPKDAIARGLADREETRDQFFARIFAEYRGAPARSRARAYHAQAAAAVARASI